MTRDLLATGALMLTAKGYQVRPTHPGEKRPAFPGWQKARSAEQVREDFELAADGAMLGLVTGNGLVCIDVDRKNGVDGEATLQGLGLSELPATVEDRTPSGGSHKFFRIPPLALVRCSAGKLGPGLDVRGENGFVVVPPSELGGQPYRWGDGRSPLEREPTDLPADWLDRLRSLAPEAKPEPAGAGGREKLYAEGDREHARERARKYLATVTPAVSGQGGHNTTYRAAIAAVELVLDPADALTVLREWNGQCSPPWSEADLQHKVRDALREVELGSRFRELAPAGPTPPPTQCPDCLVYIQPSARYVGLTPDGAAWNLDATMDQTAARRVLIANGVPPADARRILDDHNVHHALEVDTIPNAGRLVERNGHKVVNAWIPPRIKPAPGEFPTLSECLDFVSGDAAGRDWLVHWMANAVQRPAERFRTAPILWGQQNTGKSVLIRAMRELLGMDNTKTIRSEDITSKFSASFATGLLVAVGEIETEDLRGATGKLRYLTGESRIMIEGKFAAAREIVNRLKVIGSTNHDNPVTVEPGDTRWSLLEQEKPAEPAYLARLDSLFTDGDWSPRGEAEVAALGHYLLQLQADRSVTTNVLKNAARDKAMAMSQSSVRDFAEALEDRSVDGVFASCVVKYAQDDVVYRYLDVPGRPEATEGGALYALYTAYSQRANRKPLGTTKFMLALQQARPAWTFKGQCRGDAGERRDLRVAVAGAGKLSVWEGLPRNRSLRTDLADRLPVPGRAPEVERASAEEVQRELAGVSPEALANLQAESFPFGHNSKASA